MRELFNMDKKDYIGTEKIFRRPSVRAVIIKDDRVLMVWSQKYDYYKFPGGGIEEGETHIEALVREVKEETGFSVIPESVTEYGHVFRRNLSEVNANEIFEQDNFYYFCEIRSEAGVQELDNYEAEERFTVKWMEPQVVFYINRCNAARYEDPDLVMREARVCDMLDLYLREEARRKQEQAAMIDMEQIGALNGSFVSAADYAQMLQFVGTTLGEDSELQPQITENITSKKIINYSRLAHIKRVLGWARRLYEQSSCKEKLDYEAIMIATIFHDVGRAAADEKKCSHAEAGEPITMNYLLDYGLSNERAEYIKNLVGRHSDKHLMKDPDIDKNLLLLMEADLLDDMGTLGIVMDCMIERAQNPRARFEDCYDHIMRYTHRQLQNNPMVTPEGRAIWDEHKRVVDMFAEHMRIELSM